MEYCRCGSVVHFLERGEKLNEDALRAIASSCLLGLLYLHNRNIIHGVICNGYMLAIRTCIRVIC